MEQGPVDEQEPVVEQGPIEQEPILEQGPIE